MPIDFDFKGSEKMRRPKNKKDGMMPAPAPAPMPAPVLETMRVRMLRTIRGSRSGTFIVGQSAVLPMVTALSWIQLGFAEEDKALDSAPETK